MKEKKRKNYLYFFLLLWVGLYSCRDAEIMISTLMLLIPADYFYQLFDFKNEMNQIQKYTVELVFSCINISVVI